MFKGFLDIEYPEYEVITPHTHNSFTVRTLTVQKEQRLKGSLVTPIKITEHLNRILWECTVSRPEGIKTYEDFVTKLTLKDRDALLYGLYHISYEEIRNYMITCVSCGKEYPVTIQASSTFNFNPYPTDDILLKVIKLPLKKTKGVFAYIKQPTLIDEINAFKSLPADSEVISVTLPIQKFTQENEGGDDKLVYSERTDILDAYMSLPPIDKKEIFNKYAEAFGNYGIELKCQTICQFCGRNDIVSIDLVEQFFRMVFSI
jgi:hypothetical protein